MYTNKVNQFYINGDFVDIKKLLSLNVISLMKAKGIANAKALSELTQSDEGGLDRSYTAGIIRKGGDGVNISLAKLDNLSQGLNVEPWQLLHPLGFNEQGTSLTADNDIDLPTLTKAIIYSETVCKETNIDDQEFKAKAIALTYGSFLNNDEDKMNIDLMKLINDRNTTK